MGIVTCKYCNSDMEDNPGSYYHMKRCEADHWRKQIEKLDLEMECLKEARKKLVAKLELARYVGD